MVITPNLIGRRNILLYTLLSTGILSAVTAVILTYVQVGIIAYIIFIIIGLLRTYSFTANIPQVMLFLSILFYPVPHNMRIIAVIMLMIDGTLSAMGIYIELKTKRH
ncbi:hypothetical protein [Vulcanisaeta souniana]|uniref:Uncharacterized protein n=1 Tax=Vulcanisaeta souniana JCM 11219 TaxID=1293586 RepID=A0A830EAT9_9CREN|nr:hypothetical protein [Vulcanisaeta souniana]BDR93558.1 hypothetical protein Vsou_26510 [Vulcanisaeta souniana JCM 11219]GGI87480.1 hypothetical protein GCM10007112_25480 [Vulcanisaeta souniana JCM 11219]